MFSHFWDIHVVEVISVDKILKYSTEIIKHVSYDMIFKFE